MLSGVQIRAARALLGWDQATLAEAAGVSLITVKRVEAAGNEIQANFQTVVKIKEACAKAGVQFLDEEGGLGYGVRLARTPRRRRAPRE